MALVRRFSALWCAAAAAACSQVAKLDQFEFVDCVVEPEATTCAGKECGKVVNNCGQPVTCPGMCAAPKVCGGCGVGPNRCGCDCAVAQDCAAQQSCVAGKCVAGRTVFFSSSPVQASMGGVAGGDVTCQTAAGQAGLKGAYKAWMSDSKTSAAARLAHSTDPYRLVDGTQVAASWTALSGTLDHAIAEDEDGKPEKNAWEVWTGTGPGGVAASVGCNDWTSGDKNAPITIVGVSAEVDQKWTAAYQQFCNRNDVHLYCFEQ